MKILFLHGWTSTPGGLKPTFLADAGYTVLNPALPDDDFDESLRIAAAECSRHQPDVIVGSSRGGAVAINMDSQDIPLVLLCPAWKRWGTATTVKPNAMILHSRADDVIPFAESEQLLINSGQTSAALVEVGKDHRLADTESLQAMKEACERLVHGTEFVDVTVFYLEMHSFQPRNLPPPRDDLAVLHAKTPSVGYYRFLYDAVGKDYHWLSRRKLTDAALATLLANDRNELHVLHVGGSPAGFAELDRRRQDEIELVQFGLMSEFIGQGLGAWFLAWTIDKVRSYQPQRLWLHTCTLDHPAAVPIYKQAGFVEYKRESIRREL